MVRPFQGNLLGKKSSNEDTDNYRESVTTQDRRVSHQLPKKTTTVSTTSGPNPLFHKSTTPVNLMDMTNNKNSTNNLLAKSYIPGDQISTTTTTTTKTTTTIKNSHGGRVEATNTLGNSGTNMEKNDNSIITKTIIGGNTFQQGNTGFDSIPPYRLSHNTNMQNQPGKTGGQIG